MKVSIPASSLRLGDRSLFTIPATVFSPGEVHCIRGRSGSGKSSLLWALCGLTPSIRWIALEEGGTFASPLESGRSAVLLQQSAPVWPHLTVFQSAWLPWAGQQGLIELRRRKEEARQRAATWLDKLDIHPTMWGRSVLRISGGERQRVAIASVMAFDAQVLLLDEPTSSLDGHSVDCFASAVASFLTPTKTVIVATHDVDLLKMPWIHYGIVGPTLPVEVGVLERLS